MTVITISRQFGSGGDEVANIICDRTGYQLFDKYVLMRVAAEAGLSDQEIFDYSENDRKLEGFFERLFGRPHSVAQVHVWREQPDGLRAAELVGLDEAHALALVRRAIELAYQMDDIVIVGRGGQMVLKDQPDVLHVRVEAALDDRIARLRGQFHTAERTFSTLIEERRAAQDIIAANDMASADYLKRIYGVNWSDPLLYHLIVNTSRLSLEVAAQMILETARQLDGSQQPA